MGILFPEKLLNSRNIEGSKIFTYLYKNSKKIGFTFKQIHLNPLFLFGIFAISVSTRYISSTAFHFCEKLPNCEKVISLENSVIIFTSRNTPYFLRATSPVQRTKRGPCDSIHARAKFLWIRISLSLFFFCDNGLFLTRGASQNLRKRCHGKKKRGEEGGSKQISPWSYGLCISCMARHPFQRLHPDATRRRK